MPFLDIFCQKSIGKKLIFFHIGAKMLFLILNILEKISIFSIKMTKINSGIKIPFCTAKKMRNAERNFARKQ
jgi:hypothetical protein